LFVPHRRVRTSEASGDRPRPSSPRERPAWEEAMITVPHLQEVTGEELAVQVLAVVMEAVLGTSQLVF
ncbi:unnamed protein product, partial [Urochloa humidicola]